MILTNRRGRIRCAMDDCKHWASSWCGGGDFDTPACECCFGGEGCEGGQP